MLQRQLEPEVMEGADTAIAYDEMDHSVVNQAFVDDMAAACSIGDERGALEVLDLGTGTAQIPILLCHQFQNIRVVAADMGASMLYLAGTNIELADLRDRIRVDRADASAMPYIQRTFDLTMSNSLVHHLPEPLPALQEAVRVTKPGGCLFFRDLVRPSSEAKLAGLVTAYAGDESEVARTMFRESLRAALSLEEIQEMTSQLELAESQVAITSDRHWTWWARTIVEPAAGR